MKKSLIFVAGLLALLAFSLVAAQSNLPGAGWLSGQQIQNVGDAPANIAFTAYDAQGNSFDCGTNTDVAVGASVNYLTADCPVGEGFVGSAVVSADQEIAAIVNVTNAGTGLASGQYKGTDGASVANTLNFPIVKHDFFGRTTTFYVQNAGNAADIVATFVTDSGTYEHTYTAIAANAMTVISPADAGVPADELGSLSVTSDSPIAGSSLEHEHNVAVGNNLQASRGFTAPDEATTVYCPLYRKEHTSRRFTTGAQVQNVSANPATVDFTFSYDGGSYQDSQTIDPGQSYTWFAGAIADIPSGSLGSAIVESDENIVAVISDRGFNVDPSPLTAYACFSAANATDTVVLPLYKEFFFGNSSGLQIQNVGTADATSIAVTYSPVGADAVTLTYDEAVAPGQSVTFFGVSDGLSPAGVTGGDALRATFGGVSITADQPIVVIANESSFAGGGSDASGQDNKNYEGFNR